ncbi:hypothetical protein EDC04DRAFT_2734011 [Pisolithus marmoratus]|nr:hypothetical protein EDC04DRAFT_2734011 [Pisolithus marmoratus]
MMARKNFKRDMLEGLKSIGWLMNYEVQDLNDEINKLSSEERHWQNQIVALRGVTCEL